MNALVPIDYAARAKAIRAKFFPPIPPVNILRPSPVVTDGPPAPRVIMRGPGADYDWHVMEWRSWRAQTMATPFQRIMREVAHKHKMTVAAIRGPRRARNFVHARQEVMYRAIEELGLSLTQVGLRLGGRDHTTILHGYRQHAKRAGLPSSRQAGCGE